MNSIETEISIIVPVFNVADYIEPCLDSLAQQDFEYSYEVLLIDDASTDTSAQHCEQYASRYPDIFTFIRNAENSGVSVTRNKGLSLCSGNYFMFVDPDDILPLTALSTLHRLAREFNAEIVKGNNSVFTDTSEYPARYGVSRNEFFHQQEILPTFFNHRKVRGHPWGKLFLHSTLGHFRFTPGVRMAQDLLYCSEVFAAAASMLICPDLVYRYRNRSTGSTGKKYQTGAYLDWLDAVERSGSMCKSLADTRAFKSLQVRTLNQLARECRQLDGDLAVSVVDEINKRKQRWDISPRTLVFKYRTGMRSIVQYLKMTTALKSIRHGIH
ncbi:MAG: glycosyltransferase family A protein [Gammaproteobacteria bacterium]|nr:glycosyltransferase family A protein [Gammaproteobacteria bacterium]